MAKTFDAAGRPFTFVGKMEVNRAVKSASKGLRKQERRLRRRVKQMDADADPITKTPKKVLTKMVADPRTDHQRRERALDELRRRA